MRNWANMFCHRWQQLQEHHFSVMHYFISTIRLSDQPICTVHLCFDSYLCLFVDTNFIFIQSIPDWLGGRFLCPAGLFLWGAGAIIVGSLFCRHQWLRNQGDGWNPNALTIKPRPLSPDIYYIYTRCPRMPKKYASWVLIG